MNLHIQPVSLKGVHQFLRRFDMSDKPIVGASFALSTANGHEVTGVCVVGVPKLDFNGDGWTREVWLLKTLTREDDHMLLKNAQIAIAAMGYLRLLIYQPNGTMTPGASGFMPGGDLVEDKSERGAPLRQWYWPIGDYDNRKGAPPLTCASRPPAETDQALFSTPEENASHE